MRMAEDIGGKRALRSNELVRRGRGEIVLSSFSDLDELGDAFSEWDESAPIAQLARGSQSFAVPVSARTITLSDPVTTAILANTTRAHVPSTLEEALLALTNGVPDLLA